MPERQYAQEEVDANRHLVLQAHDKAQTALNSATEAILSPTEDRIDAAQAALARAHVEVTGLSSRLVGAKHAYPVSRRTEVDVLAQDLRKTGDELKRVMQTLREIKTGLAL